MGDVYGHSTITIAAAYALNSYSGFLHKRKHGTIVGNSVDSEGDVPTGDVFVLPCPESWPVNRTVVLQLSTDSPIPKFLVRSHKQSPLKQRAWTLQEQLISRRFISFDEEQLFWECKSGSYWEGWALDASSLFSWEQSEASELEQMYSQSLWHFNPTLIGKSPTGSPLDEWYLTLEEFKQRNIKYFTDMLPAISGLAREFALKTGDDYLAGIWKSDFARGLSWHVLSWNAHDGERPETDSTSAPSWSWASQQFHKICGIAEPDILYTFGKERQVAHHIPLPQLLAPILVKTEIIPHHSDKLGKIKSGKLFLEGCSRNATILWKPTSTAERTRAHIELPTLRPTNYNQHLGVYMDNWKFVNRWQPDFKVELKCLLLFRSGGKSFNFLHCLLLDKVGEVQDESQYRRCGVMNIKHYNNDPVFLENWERESLTLV
jgi:hypothetical protein